MTRPASRRPRKIEGRGTALRAGDFWSAVARRALLVLGALAALAACAGAASALPDLRAALTAPPSASDGYASAVGITVMNWGNETADNVLTGVLLDGTPLLTLDFGSIGAGLSTTLSPNISWVCGYHNVTAIADYNATVTESNESNNVGVVAVAATATPRFWADFGGELGSYNVTLNASNSTGCPPLDFFWDAGELGTRNGTVAVFETLLAGPFTFTLRATPQADAGLAGTTTANWVIANAPPVIESASMPVDHVNTGAHIDLILRAYDPDGFIDAYFADFGDGHNATVLGNISDYAYAKPGNYTVTIRVTDNLGLTNETTVMVEVRNRAPTAHANLPYVYTQIGDRVRFDASDSTDPEHGVLTARWDFGDGATAEGMNVSHAYARGGTFTAKLTVTDEYGASSEEEIQVTVLGGGGDGGASAIVTAAALAILVVAVLFFLYRRRKAQAEDDAAPAKPDADAPAPKEVTSPVPPAAGGPAARVVEGAPPEGDAPPKPPTP